MRHPVCSRGNPLRVLSGTLACAALALIGGASVTGSTTWRVGDLVVCVGSGQCRIYSSTSSFTTISVPSNPKKETGEPAWSSAFALYVVDANNRKVHVFSKTAPHTILQTIDTAAASSTGIPGPLVVDSAGNVYVGMTNLDVILKYNRAGTLLQNISSVNTENGGGFDWMALADDHKTLWFTSSGHALLRTDLTASNPSSTQFTLSTDGTAAGLRILPVTPSFDPDVKPTVDGTNGILVADGVNIKQVVAGVVTKSYDLSTTANEGWRAVTLYPDGKRFAASTGDGRIYTFVINGSGSPSGAPIVTGSTTISGTSFKGGNQLNTRTMNFGTAAATNARQMGVFGNPLADATDAFPRHAFGVMIPSKPATSSDLLVVVSDNWANGDGFCPSGPAGSDYDCRADAFNPLPRCIPYVNNTGQTDCVFYRVEDADITVPGSLLASLLKFIDFHTPANGYTSASCTGNTAKGNPRILFDALNGGPFTLDITVGTIQTAGDPILGRGGGGSDYGAFDRCIAQPGTFATVLNPQNNKTVQGGRSLPIEFIVTTATGQDVSNAVTPPNNASLLILHNPSGLFFLEPQPTPGSSPFFFTAEEVILNNIPRTLYKGVWDTTGLPLGLYTLTITSIDNNAAGPGLFAPVSINVTLVKKAQ